MSNKTIWKIDPATTKRVKNNFGRGVSFEIKYPDPNPIKSTNKFTMDNDTDL